MSTRTSPGQGQQLTNGRLPDAIEYVPTSTDVGLAVGAALAASGSVTPLILTIDKAVVQSAAGTRTLAEALVRGVRDVFLRPQKLLRSAPLWMVWGVYGSTYTAANLIDVYCERAKTSKGNASAGKLVGTTAVNMSASLVKDVAFAKLFGTAKDAASQAKQAAKKVPPATYGLFLMRDTLTIAGGFTVPPVVSSLLISTKCVQKPATADKLAQLISPMGMQLVCTPLHLLALNMFNEPNATMTERLRAVWRTTPEATFIRMFRFLGAYGIGGLSNKSIILKGREWSAEKYYPKKKAP